MNGDPKMISSACNAVILSHECSCTSYNILSTKVAEQLVRYGKKTYRNNEFEKPFSFTRCWTNILFVLLQFHSLQNWIQSLH